MQNTSTYEPLSEEDKNTLEGVRNSKLRQFIKVAFATLLLPYACALVVLAYLNLIVLYGKLKDPTYLEELIYPRTFTALIEWVYYFTLGFSHIFIIVIVANAIYFLFKVLKYCIDPIGRVKKIIPFFPEKYRPPGLTDHFIKTGIIKPDFIAVDDDIYFNVNEEEEYYLEVAPYSNYLLGVKDRDGKYLRISL